MPSLGLNPDDPNYAIRKKRKVPMKHEEVKRNFRRRESNPGLAGTC